MLLFNFIVMFDIKFLIMELIDKIIGKVGNDKVLHFLGGGFICSLISFVVILQESSLSSLRKIAAVSIGTIVVFILSLMKELFFDKETDWKDVLASVLGCIPVFIAVAIGVWFNYLSA